MSRPDQSPASRLVNRLASLPERQMRRVEWRRLLLYSEPEEVAERLEEVVRCCLGGDVQARVAELAFVDLLLRAKAKEDLALEALTLAAESTASKSVGFLLMDPPPARIIDARTRENMRISPLPLGVRKWHSSLPDRKKFEALLADPHPSVVAKLTVNPRVTESDIVGICARRPNFPDVLNVVARSRWLESERVRHALIQNPYVRSKLAIGLLPQMGSRFLAVMRYSTQVHGSVRDAARYWLSLSPGWREPAP